MTREDKQAEPVDIHVGQVIRRRRKALGMSQEDLATALNVTPQQVQKYETAASRISASKLFQAARTLKVPAGYFFSEIDEMETVSFVEEIETTVSSFLKSEDGRELALLFPLIPDAAVRKHFLGLARAMATTGTASKHP